MLLFKWAQLNWAKKQQLKNTPPLFLNVFTILVSFKFKYSILYFNCQKQERAVWRKREQENKKQKEAVFPTTSSFFDVAGSRSSSSSDINVSSSHSGAEDASQTFAHLRQWESTSIIVPFLSSWANLVHLHFKILWILFWYLMDTRWVQMLNKTIKWVPDKTPCHLASFNSVLICWLISSDSYLLK